MIDIATNLWQEFIYGVLKRRPTIDFSEMPSQINFVSHYDAERDVHWVEAPSLPEFIVSGKDAKELAIHINDTLMVYFDVPTYFAKRINIDNTIFNFENKKTNQLETVHLDYKKELDKVLT